MSLNSTEVDGLVHESITLDKIGYSVDEVSKQTSLSKAFLRQKIRREELKATYFGRRIVILRDDLEAFLRNGSK